MKPNPRDRALQKAAVKDATKNLVAPPGFYTEKELFERVRASYAAGFKKGKNLHFERGPGSPYRKGYDAGYQMGKRKRNK